MTNANRRARARRQRRIRIMRQRIFGLSAMVMAFIATYSICFAGNARAAMPHAEDCICGECCELGEPAFIVLEDEPVPLADSFEAESAPQPYTELEAVTLAKMLWGECRGCGTTSQAGSAWCALNRVDDPRWSDDLITVITQPSQFFGYDESHPVDPGLLALAEDVLSRYHAEKAGDGDAGRVLPKEYVYFTGDGTDNYFRKEFADTGDYWDWSMASPYGD